MNYSAMRTEESDLETYPASIQTIKYAVIITTATSLTKVSKLVQVGMLMICIWQAPSGNMSQQTGYTDSGLL
jgi:hypothetical protein